MLRYIENVVTLEMDEETCTGCGMCVIVCPHGVLELRDRKAVITDRDACMECGACAINCPVGAVSVRTGTGCASGILLGSLGIDNECCGGSGVSPDGSSCCDSSASPFNMLKGTDCCSSPTKDAKKKNKKSC